MAELYSPTLDKYFERCWTLLKNLGSNKNRYRMKIGKDELAALVKSIKRQLFSKQGPAYGKFLLKTIFIRPKLFAKAVALAIKGYHFEKHTRDTIEVHNFKSWLVEEMEKFRGYISEFTKTQTARAEEINHKLKDVLSQAEKRYQELIKQVDAGFKETIREELDKFAESLKKSNLETILTFNNSKEIAHS